MKIKKYLLIAAVTIFAAACDQKAEKDDSKQADTEETTENDYSQMQVVSLDDYNVPAKIYLPNTSKGKALISELSSGGVEIIIGDHFGIEIIPFGLSKEEFKAELNGDLVYTIDYLEENEQSILYKKTIKDSEVDAEFHFFLEKDLNGDVYELKSLREMEFNESAAKQMLKAAKSFQSKQEV